MNIKEVFINITGLKNDSQIDSICIDFIKGDMPIEFIGPEKSIRISDSYGYSAWLRKINNVIKEGKYDETAYSIIKLKEYPYLIISPPMKFVSDGR